MAVTELNLPISTNPADFGEDYHQFDLDKCDIFVQVAICNNGEIISIKPGNSKQKKVGWLLFPFGSVRMCYLLPG